jgi:hypothetical protein
MLPGIKTRRIDLDQIIRPAIGANWQNDKERNIMNNNNAPK